MLEAYEVDYVFGVPGDTSIPFYEALRTSASITHVLARDERGAAYMADVYARVSGRPGVCEGPSGAGALYLAPGVAEANASSIPVIALCSDTPIAADGRNVLTELDQPALFAPITKWTARASSADRIPELVRRAFRTATTGRPGAVQLAFPEDVLAAPLASTAALHAEAGCTVYPAHRQAPDPAAVQAAAELLRVAERPAIVAGGGVRVAGAWNELTSLAEALGAPVGTSINGHGAIDDRHRLSLGVVGGNGARPEANDALAGADVVLFVGCKTDSVTTCSWQLPASDGSVTIVHLDVDPGEIGNTYPTAAGVVGDAQLGLAALDAAVRAGGRADRPCWTDPAAIRARWDAAQLGAATSDAIPIRPQRVLRTLLDLLPDDPVIVADAGTATPFTSALFTGPAGRHIVIPRGFGGLGYALPGVVGAALARPDATVVGLMGDGSFAMAAGDLETIARLGLPVTLVHFNNGAFGWIRALQHHHPKADFFGVDFSTDTDYAAIARGFGLTAHRVSEPDDLGATLKQALDDDGPSFVDVVTAAEDVETPPVHAWVDKAVGR
jgi:acetolactate synthase I/II/III large subunit